MMGRLKAFVQGGALSLAALFLLFPAYFSWSASTDDQARCQDPERGLLSAPSALTGTLTVTVSGLETEEGCLWLGLFTRENWGDGPEPGSAWLRKRRPVSGSDCGRLEDDPEKIECVLVLTEIPYGQYAIAAAHDENLNGEICAEPRPFCLSPENWGISNYSYSEWTFGPEWDQAHFSFDGDLQRIEVPLNDTTSRGKE